MHNAFHDEIQSVEFVNSSVGRSVSQSCSKRMSSPTGYFSRALDYRAIRLHTHMCVCVCVCVFVCLCVVEMNLDESMSDCFGAKTEDTDPDVFESK